MVGESRFVSLNYALQDEYEDGFSMYSFYKDINGMNADEYIAYVMKLYRAEMERLANDKALPDGVRKYRELGVKGFVMRLVCSGESNLETAYREANHIGWDQREIDFKAPEFTDKHFAVLQELDVNRLDMLYARDFPYCFDIVCYRIPSLDRLEKILGSQEGFLIDYFKLQGIYDQLENMKPLTKEQRRNLASIDPYYTKAFEQVKQQIDAKVAESKVKAEKRIREIPSVSEKKLFDAIMARYKGKVVMVDLWATPDTVLAIGSTTEGRTVYASFLRGGNEVNEISLEAIHVVEAAADSANKVVDVKNKFAALPIDGVQSNLEGFPGSYDPTVNHIQGYAQYDSCDHTRYSILTHSVGTAPYAHIVAGPKTGSDKWGFKTYLQNWRHPGGVQVMGDYLLVPSEQDASAHIALYDLRSLAVKELRRVETFDLAVSHKAGALGITSYEDKNGIEYYVMIVAHLDGENTVYHVYRALASNGIENARFSEVGSFESDKDFQGFGLITEDGTNDIYMIGLWSPSEGVTFADYAYLYQLNTETWTIGEALQQIHMVSVGGMAGMMGVHFRYGANVYVADDGTLTLSATERNSVLGSSLATNDWIPAIVN